MKYLFLLFFVTAILLSGSTQAPALTIYETEGNNSFASAQSIDSFFSVNSNPNVFGTLPTVSILASNGGYTDVDYYRFTVGGTGIGYFDIDDVTVTDLMVDLETTLSLFDGSYNLLAADFDTLNYPEDPGSVSTFDSFLGIYNFVNPGVYYIAVSNQGNKPLSLGTFGGNLGRPDCELPACDPSNPWADLYNGGRFYLGDSGATEVGTSNGDWASGNYTLHVTIANPVPEPSTMILLIVGLISFLVVIKGRQYQSRFAAFLPHSESGNLSLTFLKYSLASCIFRISKCASPTRYITSGK